MDIIEKITDKKTTKINLANENSKFICNNRGIGTEVALINKQIKIT